MSKINGIVWTSYFLITHDKTFILTSRLSRNQSSLTNAYLSSLSLLRKMQSFRAIRQSVSLDADASWKNILTQPSFGFPFES